jgi:hypothetical protein
MTGWLWLLLLLYQNPTAPGCNWAPAVQIGTLDPVVNESSGMAISRRIANRSYRHNDSGDAARFFVMDLDGRNIKDVAVAGIRQKDWEDMALGPCDSTTDCLFFGDIGDNDHRRKNYELVVVREKAAFPSSVSPDYHVTMRYPDERPRNAEAMAVHPDGSVYIATKDAAHLELFRLKAEQWRNGKGVQTLELVLTLDWPKLLPRSLALGRVATAMDISPDGKRFLILTYVEAVEFFFDLSKPIPQQSAWKEARHYRRIPITTLEQEEAIAWLPDGKGFLYDTERAFPTRPARIFKVSCAN